MIRRWSVIGAAVLTVSVAFAASGQAPRTDREALEAIGQILVEQGIVLPTTTAPTTTTLAASTTTNPPTTTTAAPVPCQGQQVAAGSNLVTVANAHPAGATFCLAAGAYSLFGTGGMPLQNGDSVIGALGPDGERLSILTGGDSVRRAFECTCSPTLIVNLVIEHFDDGKAKTQPMGPSMIGVTWDNIESRFNGGRGMYTWDQNVVRNSYIHHNGELGMAGSGDNVLIENNVVAFNNHLGETIPGGEAGGSKWTNAVGVIVRGNHFHHNCGAGIWFDGSGNSEIVIEDNLAEDNWGPGIFVELLGDNATIRFNEAYRNTFGSAGSICQNTPGGESSGAGNGGIRVSGSHNVEVHDNLLVDNDGGISSTQDDRRTVIGLNVHDNDISWSVGFHGLQDTSGGAQPNPFVASANNHYEGNAYHYSGSDSTPFKWDGDKTFAEWQAAGHDLTGSIS